MFKPGDVVYVEGSSKLLGDVVRVDEDGVEVCWRECYSTEQPEDLVHAESVGPKLISLTSVGRVYALRNAGESVVARVALDQSGDWPDRFTDVARRLMNAEGDGTKLTDEERTILVWPTRT